MKHHKGILILGILLIVLAAGFGIWLYFDSTYPEINKQTEEIEYRYTVDRHSSIDDYCVIKKTENTVCAVTQVSNDDVQYRRMGEDRICYNSFVVCENIEAKGYTIYSKDKTDGYNRVVMDFDEFGLDVYDVKTKEKVKSIDLVKILKKYPEYSASTNITTIYQEDKEWLGVEMYPLDDSLYNQNHYDVVKVLLVDPESEEYKLIDDDYNMWFKESEKPRTSEEIALEEWADKKGLRDFEASGTEDYSYFTVKHYGDWPNLLLITMDAEGLPENGTAIYEAFPELKPYIGAERNTYYVTLILPPEKAREFFLEE